ncbi:60S ribosomal protein L7-2, putative [Trichomonas vaginalis G3]|uniref:60S ribosomal protein L7-2, putative n=1 Tax=Trichomonas vaginalis (strain ATCC PRA-98 / G3) TaxID=412133 RepID=A2EMI2_TRIV3|nr:maturation of LSU-rRNA from tricistronic rRNA transcript (SSU-rRNA, 5.8S rRNA, LSU-rRNA) [Trichomonas vaginalis G3]XP_001318361.1 maturation of LSU-rRNA from tricistronic rRNA transcript (SSU-rRNA, 5.8S rRNA, LSU-rRNA) [Trichomonas vaginalis G3]EAX93808.1 60S ribosomal protein L7-2, putative [Trichomonas vaginalis G3]EAY06138.1 60S ribosomal protein L7-2, putative [Trichomonas vaginalis G3]KAI5486353.1 maturation of LSU-rRNA from tricistronic rRNA transcript (SSU-rRNA, 5.8S rRNA, LSU-rRNA) [|eukprot:XP_001306738.1 60S ribosomal protein L7-2 [Trichomonas vaginalis G3]
MSKPMTEALKKIQARTEAQKAAYLKKKEELVAAAKANEAKIQERAKKYAAEYVAQVKAEIDAENKATAEGAFYVPAEAKFAFVIRTKGTNKLHPHVRKILHLFRLNQKHNAIFVRLNKATIEMLKRVTPQVAFGYPSVDMVRKLIYRLGTASLNGQRIPIVDNQIIKVALGQFGIESVEDLAHEIYTVGPHFAAANRFLAVFKLHAPKGGYKKINRAYVEGGDYGNREHLIDELIERMI